MVLRKWVAAKKKETPLFHAFCVYSFIVCENIINTMGAHMFKPCEKTGGPQAGISIYKLMITPIELNLLRLFLRAA